MERRPRHPSGSDGAPEATARSWSIHIYDIYLSYRQAAICYFITDNIHVHILFHILIITWLLFISINLRVRGKVCRFLHHMEVWVVIIIPFDEIMESPTCQNYVGLFLPPNMTVQPTRFSTSSSTPKAVLDNGSQSRMSSVEDLVFTCRFRANFPII